jgi:hypothetical protein
MRYAPFLLLASMSFGQATHIGKHQISETLQEWANLEPQTWNARPRSAIAPHRLGEPFSDWLRLNNMDLTYICGTKHNRGDNSMDFKSVCKRLTAFQNGGSGEFYTADADGKTGWRFANGQVDQYSTTKIKLGLRHTDTDVAVVTREQWSRDDSPEYITTNANKRRFKWDFDASGRLTEVFVTPDSYADFFEEVALLTSTFGKPEMESVPYMNGFGARWERARAVWHMPDHTVIFATEFSKLDQTNPGLESVFFGLPKPTSVETKPNPYK